MTATGASRKRDVIPRWRFLEAAIEVGEFEPLHPVATLELSVPDVREQRRAFEGDRGLYTAGDLLSASLSTGHAQAAANEAADLVLNYPEPVPSALLRVARAQLGLVSGREVSQDSADGPVTVRRLRHALRANPRNPLRWLDLSLAQATQGHHDQATRSMQAALTLAPTHRLVLRSAARLFLLREDPERALALLSSADPMDDPWIAASLLAVSEVLEKPVPRVRDFRSMLNRSGFAPRQLGELASQLATVELRGGNDRRARKLMAQALVDPTENALAQVEWARDQGISLPLPDRLPPHPYEASALVAFYESNFEAALALGVRWQADQPFDARPASFVSYIASLALEDYASAAEACRIGLIANPNDSMLRNNYAFALASVGDTAAASRELTKLPSEAESGRDSAIFDATRGLVAYRVGERASGRELYGRAVSYLRRGHDSELAALVALLWAREEVSRGAPEEADEVLRVADQLSMRLSSRMVDLWRRRILPSA